MVDEKKLQSLLVVVDKGSISKAAADLDYSQPALTQMMNSLEEELGCRLLNRSYSGVVLTEEGRSLLPYVKSAVRALSQLRQAAKQTATTHGRILRMGAYPSITQSWLSSAIRSFQQLHPNITIELHVGGYEIGGLLESGKLDVAFLSEALDEACTWIPLMQDPFVAALPKRSPLADNKTVSMEQLLSYTLILEETHELQPLLRQFHIKPGMQINAADDSSRIALVEQGMGVAILPATSLAKCSGRISMIPLIPPISRTLGAVYIGIPTKETELFLDFLKTIFLSPTDQDLP